MEAIDFYSITVRVFKLPLEDRCEDFGQVATYKGTLKETPDSFILDDHHEFKTNVNVPVCGNTAAMLQKTRFAKYFDVVGDLSTHHGLFKCSPVKIGGNCC